ncbi:MAG: hypothetical protein HWD58_13615 [Bacteroidota bacterium]|nr:MAG: hypothetical protein HWD58_13615 [Bacteroidota bacterium]
MSNNHVGVGLSYERLVNQYVGLRIPVMVGINSNYVNVGLEAKLYPTRNNGPVKYAIAPMIMYGNGKIIHNEWVYDPNLGYSVYVKRNTPYAFRFLIESDIQLYHPKEFLYRN